VRGPLRKAIAKGKIADLKAYMDSVKTLVAKYVPPEQGLIQKAQQRGDVAVAPNPSNATFKVTVSNYIQKGDAVAVVVHEEDNHLAELNISTWLNAGRVSLRSPSRPRERGRLPAKEGAHRLGQGRGRDHHQQQFCAVAQ
jgi:hypothetical protein